MENENIGTAKVPGFGIGLTEDTSAEIMRAIGPDVITQLSDGSGPDFLIFKFPNSRFTIKQGDDEISGSVPKLTIRSTFFAVDQAIMFDMGKSPVYLRLLDGFQNRELFLAGLNARNEAAGFVMPDNLVEELAAVTSARTSVIGGDS